MDRQWGGGGWQGVEIMDEIPDFPWSADVAFLSHDVGECVCMVSVKDRGAEMK